jgi:hypothetical protein
MHLGPITCNLSQYLDKSIKHDYTMSSSFNTYKQYFFVQIRNNNQLMLTFRQKSVIL